MKQKILLLLVILLGCPAFPGVGAPTTEHPSEESPHNDIELLDEETPDDAQSSSNKAKQLITAWLGIPESQLTLKNMALNSLPHIFDKTHCYSFFTGATMPAELINRIDTMHQTLGKHGTFTANIFKFLVSELAKTSSPINKKLNAYSILTHKSLQSLAYQMICNYSLTEQNYSGYNLFSALLVLHKAIRSMRNRIRLTNKLKSKHILVYSRSIPENMRGKDYLVFESATGYTLRNIVPIISNIEPIISALDSLLRQSEDFFRLNDLSSSKKSLQRLLDGAQYATAWLPNVIKEKTRQIQGSLSQNVTRSIAFRTFIINLLFKAPFTLPVAAHIYILQSDYSKLHKEERDAINALAYEDWFYATEILNNLATTPHAINTGIQWCADQRANR